MPMHQMIASALLLAAMGAGARQPLPAGYRFPTDADRTHEWAASRKAGPTPFHARADLDGDGREDDAWILISTQGPGWGLFVYLNSSSSEPAALGLVQNRGDVRPQTVGVRVVPKGSYKTGCGKGRWRCDQGEPKSLRLKRPAIDFFKASGASSYIWWDARTRKLVQTRMTD
jgi:hypothetical protein